MINGAVKSSISRNNVTTFGTPPQYFFSVNPDQFLIRKIKKTKAPAIGQKKYASIDQINKQPDQNKKPSDKNNQSTVNSFLFIKSNTYTLKMLLLNRI